MEFCKLAITAGFTGTTGSPVIGSLDYSYFSYITNNITDTTIAGDVVFDAIRLADVTDYYKALDTVTFDETDGSMSMTGKITVSEANGFLLDGYLIANTDTSELAFVKAKFPDNSKGTTDLFKMTIKTKQRNINQV